MERPKREDYGWDSHLTMDWRGWAMELEEYADHIELDLKGYEAANEAQQEHIEELLAEIREAVSGERERVKPLLTVLELLRPEVKYWGLGGSLREIENALAHAKEQGWVE